MGAISINHIHQQATLTSLQQKKQQINNLNLIFTTLLALYGIHYSPPIFILYKKPLFVFSFYRLLNTNGGMRTHHENFE